MSEKLIKKCESCCPVCGSKGIKWGDLQLSTDLHMPQVDGECLECGQKLTELLECKYSGTQYEEPKDITVINLPCYGISIYCNTDYNYARIECTGLTEKEQTQYGIKAILFMIKEHASHGGDVFFPEYIESIETAILSLINQTE